MTDSPTRRRAACLCPNCNRVPPVGQTICGRCWPYVPGEMKLAMQEHYELLVSRKERELWPFLRWSYWRLVNAAAWQGDLVRRLTRDGKDPEEYARWGLDETGALRLIRTTGEPFYKPT